MKTFFDCIYIQENEEESPKYPIKLEYFKTINVEENAKAKFGIEVVETEYISGKVNIENERVEQITNNEQEIENILTVLKNNIVTPVGVQDALEEIFIRL